MLPITSSASSCSSRGPPAAGRWRGSQRLARQANCSATKGTKNYLWRQPIPTGSQHTNYPPRTQISFITITQQIDFDWPPVLVFFLGEGGGGEVGVGGGLGGGGGGRGRAHAKSVARSNAHSEINLDKWCLWPACTKLINHESWLQHWPHTDHGRNPCGNPPASSVEPTATKVRARWPRRPAPPRP